MVDLAELTGRQVVLDAAGTILYLGTLEQITAEGFWLGGADVHDTREGHMSKELYVIEAKRDGICANRQRVFVLRSVVMSVSALDDVVEH
jgi:hypothetical protein